MSTDHTPTTRRVLLVTTVPLDSDDVSRILAESDASDGEVVVLSPSVNESRIAFWVSDADEAIEDAKAVASETVRAAAGSQADVHVAAAAVGESDPLLAIGDALSEFAADQIVTVFRTGDGARYREDRLESDLIERTFGLPVRAHEIAT